VNNKHLGIDFGRVRIGLAISDPTGTLARGFRTIHRRRSDEETRESVTEIAAIVREEQVMAIVLGLPRRTDGQPSEMAVEVRAFAALLAEATGIEPQFIDERYTSVLAERTLSDAPGRKHKGKGRRAVIDQVAAEIILQDYLNRRNDGEKR